jgi:hypothetical protein
MTTDTISVGAPGARDALHLGAGLLRKLERRAQRMRDRFAELPCRGELRAHVLDGYVESATLRRRLAEMGAEPPDGQHGVRRLVETVERLDALDGQLAVLEHMTIVDRALTRLAAAVCAANALPLDPPLVTASSAARPNASDVAVLRLADARSALRLPSLWRELARLTLTAVRTPLRVPSPACASRRDRFAAGLHGALADALGRPAPPELATTLLFTYLCGPAALWFLRAESIRDAAGDRSCVAGANDLADGVAAAHALLLESAETGPGRDAWRAAARSRADVDGASRRLARATVAVASANGIQPWHGVPLDTARSLAFAWELFLGDPDTYARWERGCLAVVLGTQLDTTRRR